MFAAFSRAEVSPFRDAATIASLRALTRRMSMPISLPITAILGGAPRGPGRVRARDQGLGRGAAGIDASAADEIALDDSHLHPGAGKAERQRWPGLAGADDDCVICSHPSPPNLRRQAARRSTL